MVIKNNPFSKNSSSILLFNGVSGISAEQHEQLSLQRYKELFLYFVSCFRSGKIEMLEKDLFDDTWDKDCYNSLGSKLFHLSVNCYLYYIGYREKEDCVNQSLKQKAQNLLSKIKNMNISIFHTLNMANVQEPQLMFFLNNLEHMPQKGNGKTLIMQDVVRDFYIFSILLSSVFRSLNIKDFFDKNEEINVYSKYMREEEKETFSIFVSIFCPIETREIEELYSILTSILQSVIVTKKLKKSAENIEKYKSLFSEDVLGNIYKTQIEEFLNKTFNDFSTKSDKVLERRNINLLSYRFLTNYVKKDLGPDVLDALLFNLTMQILDLLEKNKVLDKQDFDTTNISDYINLLEKHSINYIIGSSDVITPYDYSSYELIEEFKKKFQYLYILSWYRNILALNSRVLSICVKNIQIAFSSPTIEEMKDEYEKSEDGLYKKKNEVEKYSENEFLLYIENTYRNITIKADISLCIGSEKIGMIIIPTKTI